MVNYLDDISEMFNKREQLFNKVLSNDNPSPTNEIESECNKIITLIDEIAKHVLNKDYDSAFTTLMDSFVVQEKQLAYKEEIEAVFFSLDKESMTLEDCIRTIFAAAINKNPIFAYGVFVIMKYIFVSKYNLR